MLPVEEYFEYLKKSIPPVLLSKRAPLGFDELITTVQDFNFYLGELRGYRHKVEDKKDIKIISVAELFKSKTSKKDWLKKLPPDHLFVFDFTKLGTKIRREFENALFRVSIYRDNVLLIINELGYFWLNDEPKNLIHSFQKSNRFLLFPELGEIFEKLKKLEDIIALRNKITHKIHLKIKFEVKKGENGKPQEIITSTYETPIPVLQALQRYRGSVKTIDYYIDKLEGIYPIIISINEDLVNYYFKNYNRKEWEQWIKKRLKSYKS